ncbi:MAG TPA: hypothetical protein VHU82_10830, partial [Vicinamibacterales bacterium]|nr:hypothetical protein [Vicinamibacterales bacterium]
MTALGALAAAQVPSLLEHAGIAYSSSAPADAVASLQHDLDAGTVTLDFDPAHGYLPAVLRALKVPVASQGLVFSKTSLQLDRIAPWTPRAIYFNDDVYVGWVQGGPIMEIATADPKLGAVFYTLDQHATDHPKFERQTQTCLLCHNSPQVTSSVPGFIMRSVYADRYGYAIPTAREVVTTDQTPLERRWGGWYVTGTVGSQRHLGNVIAPVTAHEISNVPNYEAGVDRSAKANVTDLSGLFNTKPYLSPHSDAVSLMVLAHQTHIHNLITVAGYAARTGSPDQQVEAAVDRLVKGMLFAKETALTAPVKGTSDFAAEFVEHGPRDHQGRSLRDLDLEHRLFRYPLSYMIYTESFDA